MKERSRLTAAAAELGDMGRWRVDIAGALVSPLISAPRLELVLRGLPIVIWSLVLLVFQSPHTHVFVRVSLFACAWIYRTQLGMESGGGTIPPFPISQRGLMSKGYHSWLGSVSPK